MSSRDRTDAHCRFADDEGDRDRRSAAPRGRRGHRLRRGRARLSDARARSSAAAHAAHRSRTSRSYTPVAGIAELKRAICDRYQADYGVEYQRVRGHRHAPAASRRSSTRALALFGPGDEVDHARAVLADAHRADQAGRRDAGRSSRTYAGGRLRDSRARRSSTRSRRARAASSSTRRAIRPAR